MQPDRQLTAQISQIVIALLDAGAQPNTHDVLGYTPLMLAVTQKNFAAATALLQHGAEVNRLTQPKQNSILVHGQRITRKTALHLAIEQENQAAINFLLEAGVTIDILNSKGIGAKQLAEGFSSISLMT